MAVLTTAGRHFFFAALFTAALFVTTAQTRAREAPPGDYRLIAAYLFNVAKFARWPDDSFVDRDAPLVLCVLGEDPFGIALDQLENETVRGRPLAVRRFPRVAVVSGCHLAFISRSERHRLELIIGNLAQLPILTVSDIEHFSERGGIITLAVEGRRLRFAVNPGAAAAAGLKLSSKLLELAAAIVEQR